MGVKVYEQLARVDVTLPQEFNIKERDGSATGGVAAEAKHGHVRVPHTKTSVGL